jgi:DHA1 family inner membrane transport protein
LFFPPDFLLGLALSSSIQRTAYSDAMSQSQPAMTVSPEEADRNSRHVSLALAFALPADTLLYLVLPMYAAQFGITLAEAGILLAANRVVRIFGYSWVTRFYARHGDRPTCLLAVGAASVCALGYGFVSGFWMLLPLRLVWGLCFGALNLSTQAMEFSQRRLRLPGSLDTWSFLEGLTLDGLFILGLSYLGKDLMPGGAVVVAGFLMMLRYLGEIVLSPLGGYFAERFGAERLLVVLSLVTCATLIGFGAGWLWSCAAAILILRALQMPLLSPIVSRRTPGAGRVQALASRLVWRDIGAGAGPVIAGVVLPVASSFWVYTVAAALLAVATLACANSWRPTASLRDA